MALSQTQMCVYESLPNELCKDLEPLLINITPFLSDTNEHLSDIYSVYIYYYETFQSNIFSFTY